MGNFKIDFIGVGAPKCGTTWVAQCLREHPEVCMPQQKEITFFNKIIINFPSRINENYSKGISWYKNNFKNCDFSKKIGEFSTHYLYDKNAPRLIAKYFPKTKIIICLRNPAERLFSHFLHIKYKTTETKLPKFEKILKKYPDFIKTGYYDVYLTEYLKRFSRSQIHIIIYENIKKDPRKIIQNLYRFLEIDEKFVPSILFVNVNPTEKKINKIRYNFLILKNLMIKSKIRKIIKLKNGNKYIQQIDNFLQKFNKYSKKPVLKKTTKQKLMIKYLPHIKKLEKITNQNLTIWIK